MLFKKEIKDYSNDYKVINNLRGLSIDMIDNAKSGHPGGALSCTDILTVLYFNQMNINEKEPKDMLRDRFVLSKGHCVPALYACLAQRGFLDKEELKTFKEKLNGKLSSISSSTAEIVSKINSLPDLFHLSMVFSASSKTRD